MSRRKIEWLHIRTDTNITYEKNRDIIQLMHILSNPSTSIEMYRNRYIPNLVKERMAL